MNSALLFTAYFTMLLSPCAVAEWGDLLNFRWLPALIRRRRTHPQESLLTSFRHERYAMAMAVEAAFLAGADQIFAVPKPFLVPKKKTVRLETPAFLEARQRVAARVAQLAVAQKLRNAAAAEDAAIAEQEQPRVVEIPADVPLRELQHEVETPSPVTATSAPSQRIYRTLLEAMGIHTTSRNPQALPLREAMPAIAAQVPAAVFREPAAVFRAPTAMPHRELAEVITMGQPRGGPEPVPPGPPRRKPGESSDVVEIAA